MFLLSKIFDAVLLSPLLFFIPMVLGTLLAGFGRAKAAFRLLLPGCLLFYCLSIAPVAHFLTAPLEQRHEFPGLSSLSCDVIVVLGAGKVPGGPDGITKAVPSHGARSRCLMGYRLWKQTGAPILVSGGDPAGAGPPSEGEAMAAFLEMLNVPSDDIAIESSSRNTRENGIYSGKIMEAKGWKHACLVTSAMHMPRSMAVFKRLDIPATAVPCDYQVVGRSFGARDFIPSANALQTCFTAFHEYLGLGYYLARGWI